ncbi:MAG: hypothetical protein AMXMBFR84_42450 [Candidatus Hydrogenedentota bacterium]
MHKLAPFPKVLRAVSVITLASFLPSATGVADVLATLPNTPTEQDTLEPWRDLPWHKASSKESFETDSIELAKVPAGDDSGVLDQDQSNNVVAPINRAGQRVLLAQNNRTLPAAAAMFASIDKKKAEINASKDAEKKLLAQGGGESQIARVEPTAGAQAQSALADGDLLAGAGDYTSAVSTYFEVFCNFPGTWESLQADKRIFRVMNRVLDGELNPSVLVDIYASLPAWQSLDVNGRYLVASMYVNNVNRLLEEDNEIALQYVSQARDTALEFLREHAAHPLSHAVADSAYAAASFMDTEALKATIAEIRTIANTSQSSYARLVAHSVLTEYANKNAHDSGAAYIHQANLIEEVRAGAVNALFENRYVYSWVKGQLAIDIALAYTDLGLYDEAIAWCERGLVVVGHPKGATARGLKLQMAITKQQVNRFNQDAGVEDLWAFVNEFPGKRETGLALTQLGALYSAASDDTNAAAIYARVIEEYPDTQYARVAEYELDYLTRHLLGSVEVADVPQEQAGGSQLAASQLCGPQALHALLYLVGVNVSVEELALQASTDSSGTTMQGLIDAAAKNNVAVSGVRVASLDELTLPAIAFTDGRHFVLVESVENGLVRLRDDEANLLQPVNAFKARWSGDAIVMKDHAIDVAEVLDLRTLMTSKGGNTPGRPVYPPPPPCTNCENGGNGGSGGVGEPPTCPIDHALRFGADCTGVGCSNVVDMGYLGATEFNSYYEMQVFAFTSTFSHAVTDARVSVIGPMEFEFRRFYSNDMGYHRGEFQGTDKVWKNNIGDGWTHTLNTYLVASVGTPPFTVTYFDSQGYPRVYNFQSTSGGNNHYARTSTGHTGEKAITLKRNTTTLAYTLTFPDGLTYEFSAATADADRYARLTAIKDASSNTISLDYNGAVGTGRLTKVSSSGASQHLQLAYAGNLITKVELKESTTVLQTTTYGYNPSNELTRVTDNASKTVDYAYGSTGGVAESRYISSITDKKGVTTALTWAYSLNGSSQYEATTIEIDDAAGLTSEFDRSVSTGVVTFTGLDNTTPLVKRVYRPISGDLSRVQYDDYYLDASTYERWSYEYNASGDLTRTSRPGNITVETYTYNASGRISTVADVNNQTVTYAYPAASLHATKSTDERGLDTLYYYDNLKRLTKVVAPDTDAAGMVYAYDTAGNITSITNPLGHTTAVQYDSYGQVTSVTNPMSQVTSYAYDSLGNMTLMTDPRSKTTTFFYAYGGCGGCGGSNGLLTKVKDALNNETLYAHDSNGNVTKVTNAMSVETDYFYDSMNRLTQVVSPSGGANESESVYNFLGQLEEHTDFDGETVEYAYDHLGRMTLTSDVVVDTISTYNSAGDLASVTDGLNHTWSYAYDNARRLTSVTDPVNKVTKYLYDAFGRMTKVGAGGSGTTDPTEYFFHGTTGLMTKTAYTSGGNTYEAVYAYDGAARLTKLADWIDDTNGLQYAYDNAGRLTRLTDYDTEYLTYAYDATGNATSMTDHHGNTTTYSYTDLNQVSTITAPGSKVWEFNYNALGQTTDFEHPNGMTTEYDYDARNRLTLIDHKDGGTTKQSFEYTLSAGGSIEQIAQDDGTHWEYEYDGRNRLTVADHVFSANIVGEYDYAYDDGDNMITRSEPFMDDFNDADYTGWTVSSGTWSASGGVLADTVANAANDLIWKVDQDEADYDTTFRYRRTSSIGDVLFWARYTGVNDFVRVEFYGGGTASIRQTDGGATAYPDTNNSLPTTQNVWYNVRVVADGADLTVWRWEDGDMPEEVLSTSSLTEVTSAQCGLVTAFWTTAEFDDVRFTGSNLKTTTTFAYDNANELTSMTSTPGGTTNLSYDDWGRMTQKTNGGFTADFTYFQGPILAEIETDFWGESDSTYVYRGDMLLHLLDSDTTLQFRWTANGRLLNVEDGASNTLVTSILSGKPVDPLAIFDSISDEYYYFVEDRGGNARASTNEGRAVVGETEFDGKGFTISQYGMPLYQGTAVATRSGSPNQSKKTCILWKCIEDSDFAHRFMIVDHNGDKFGDKWQAMPEDGVEGGFKGTCSAIFLPRRAAITKIEYQGAVSPSKQYTCTQNGPYSAHVCDQATAEWENFQRSHNTFWGPYYNCAWYVNTVFSRAIEHDAEDNPS